MIGRLMTFGLLFGIAAAIAARNVTPTPYTPEFSVFTQTQMKLAKYRYVLASALGLRCPAIGFWENPIMWLAEKLRLTSSGDEWCDLVLFGDSDDEHLKDIVEHVTNSYSDPSYRETDE